GRAILGIGAAWYEDEAARYGYAWPPARERLDRLEDALRICRAMFTQDRATVDGRYHRVHDALNNPRPIQSGGPKILVGGGGERRTLKLAAQYADACNIFDSLDAPRPRSRSPASACSASRPPHPPPISSLTRRSRGSRAPSRRTSSAGCS